MRLVHHQFRRRFGIPFPLLYMAAATLALSFVSSAAHAARPMITDDARIVDAKACQLETWVKKNRGSTEYWALPACNFTGKLELTAGGALGNDDEGTQTADIVLQGKTLFKPLETNSWGIGLTAGTVRHPEINPERNLIGDYYAYVPTSFSFKENRFVLHTNIGWLYEQGANQHRMTWGLGSETQLVKRTWLIAETFGRNQGKPFFQVGFRHWIVLNRVQIDTTYGNRFGTGSEEQWFSIGLRLLSPPFLP